MLNVEQTADAELDAEKPAWEVPELAKADVAAATASGPSAGADTFFTS